MAVDVEANYRGWTAPPHAAVSPGPLPLGLEATLTLPPFPAGTTPVGRGARPEPAHSWSAPSRRTGPAPSTLEPGQQAQGTGQGLALRLEKDAGSSPPDGHFLELERPLLWELEEAGLPGSRPPAPCCAHRPPVLPSTGGLAVAWLR